MNWAATGGTAAAAPGKRAVSRVLAALRDEEGAATAEYAVATMAAVEG